MQNNIVPAQTSAPQILTSVNIGVALLLAFSIVCGLPMIAALLAHCVERCRDNRQSGNHTPTLFVAHETSVQQENRAFTASVMPI